MIPTKTSRVEAPNQQSLIRRTAGRSPEPATEFGRISAAVKNGNYRERLLFNCEVNTIAIEPLQPQLPRAAHFWKKLGFLASALQRLNYSTREVEPQAGLAFFIPGYRLEEFQPGLRLEGHPPERFLANRVLISFSICFKGIPLLGFFSNSAMRRSSSAICSGVRSGSTHPSSSPNSCHICSTKARFSCVGIGRIFSMSSAALMRLIYRRPGFPQTQFSVK